MAHPLPIPYGATRTYCGIARELSGPGRRMSAQAVGGAVGGTPIAILIPCHRVIGAGGNLTGYGGGLTAKMFLLQLEGVDTSQRIWPKVSVDRGARLCEYPQQQER